MSKNAKKVATKASLLAMSALVVAAPVAGAQDTATPAETTPETNTTATAATEVAVPNTDELKAKIAEAEKAGVKVTTGETETRDFSLTEQDQQVKDAEADYESQIDKLDAAIETQKAHDDNFSLAVAARDSIIEQNKSINANNDQLKAIVDAAQKAHDEAVAKNEEIAKLRSQIQESNDVGLKAQVAADEEWESTVASIVASNNKIIETNNKSLEANAQKLTEAQKAVDAATPGTDAYNEAVKAYNLVAQEIKQDNQRIADENKAAIEKYNADMAKAQAKRQKALDAAAAVEAENEALAKAYAESMDVFQSKLADYEAKMAEYQRVLAEQTSTDKNTALRVDEIAIPNPFTLNENRNSLVTPANTANSWTKLAEPVASDEFGGQPADFRNDSTGNLARSAWSFGAADYNSDRIVEIKVKKGDTGSITWEKVFIDSESGRAVNLTSNYTINEAWSPSGDAALYIYSNVIDNISMWKVNASQQFNLTYADTGEAYDKPFYFTAASLNTAGNKGVDAGSGAEFVSIKDDSKVMSVYQNSESWIEGTVQPSSGHVADSGVNNLWRGIIDQNQKAQELGVDYGDTSGGSFKYLGVTFLVKNGASFNFGTQWDNAEKFQNEVVATDSYQSNHLQLSFTDTVAPTTVQPVRPTPPNPDEYTPKVVPTVPEVNIPPADTQEIADVQVLAFTPLAPEPFIPQEEPEDVPVPPVPDYNPVPELTVPEEPVKEQAEVDVRLLKLMLQPTDLRIAKTVIDNDASDGAIAFRIDGANAGPGTAHEAIVSDLMGEGITSIKLSDLTYNGESVSDNKARVDGDKVFLKDVASGDAYSFTVTAEVDPNADAVTNAVKVTSPDDPDKGGDGETQRNDTPEDDTDGKDEETTPIKNQAKVRIDKKMTSFDEETGVATFEVNGINEKAIAHSVVIEDFGGTGLSDIKVESFSSKLGDKTSTVATEEAQPSAEATEEATAAPTDGAGSDVVVPTAEAQPTEEATPVPVESTAVEPERISLSAGQTGAVNVFATADDVADLKLGEPSGPASVKWDGGQSVEVTLKDNATGEVKIPYTITRDGQATEGYILVTVLDAEGNPTAIEEAFVAPKASEQGDLKATDVNDLDDYTIDGAKVTVDAMGVGETFTAIVTAKVADDARTIDNVVGVTTPDDPEAKGKDGDQVNEDVPSDTDGWDKTTDELDRPADLKVLKEAVDSDASDHKVSFRITGSNVGVGDSPETVIAEMAEARVGLENPVISDVKLGDAELDSARYTVAEDNESVTVDDLKSGETVSYLIEFDVTPGATEITNAASITSPKSPVDPNGDIQDNEDIPGDEDQKDKSNIDPTPVDLKVLKEVVDGDASDGKLSFKVTGANLGTGNAPETRITDEFAEGLKNPVISEVSEGATIIEEDGVTGILVDDLKAGAEASFIVEFDVEPGVTSVSNAAFIDSPFDPVDPEGDIQDNNDLPGDEDQKDKTSLDLGEGQLKVDKEVIEDDLSDGKVTFKISGMNSGATVEQDVLLKDAEREGLVNGVISEVQAPEGVETSVNGESLTLSQLKPGEQANFLITFEVLPEANAYSNVATIESKDLKPGDGEVQENEGLDADTDQKDRVSLEKPAEPGTPAPSDPADPTDPAQPADPANPGDPSQTTVKGESAATGGRADVAKKVALTGFAALLATVGGVIISELSVSRNQPTRPKP